MGPDLQLETWRDGRLRAGVLSGAPARTIERRNLGRRRKLYDRILSGRSDNSISFDQVRSLLLHLGFEERVRGSHHVFKRPEIPERVNIQPTSEGTCKTYQVRQLRDLLKRYNLREEL